MSQTSTRTHELSYVVSREWSQMSIPALLSEAALARGDELFFTHVGGAVTFGEFEGWSNRIANALHAAGIEAGTRVATVMNSSAEYYALWFALAKLGAVEVAVNPALRGEFLRHQFAVGDATAVIVDADYFDDVVSVAAKLAAIATIVVRGLVDGGAVGVRPAPQDLAELVAAASDVAAFEPPAPENLGGVLFTSGTTGPSKAVALSHHFLVAYGLMYAEVNRLAADDVLINFQPVFHMTGKFVPVATLASGGRMHLMERFSVSRFWDDVRAHGVTNMVAVGGVCTMLLSRPERSDDLENPLRTCYAVPAPPDVHDAFQRRFDCTVTTIYGSTEAGLPIVHHPGDTYVPGASGRASPYFEVRCVDEHDRELPPNMSGELVVRSRLPYLMCDGYYGQPDKTVAAWRNLWFHTGDRGRFDEHGNFFLEDRLTDSLRRKGENISSYELETQIRQHPSVEEVAAVAAPSDLAEDEIRLVVKALTGHTLTPDTLFEYCIQALPYFMVPRYIEIVHDFPRTPTAKIEKYKLRAMGLTADAWDSEAHGWSVRNRRVIREPPVGPEGAR
jgi:carnitine-CoA ligase